MTKNSVRAQFSERSFQETIAQKRYHKVMHDKSERPDPATVFGGALSLWNEFKIPSKANERVNPADSYNGRDEFMRVVMGVATRFGEWASLHIAFDELTSFWPYLLEDKFGAACLRVMGTASLEKFDDCDCLRVALLLRIPVRLSNGLPVPVDVTAANPNPNSPFSAFRIQTVREAHGDFIYEPFTSADDPFDDNFKPPQFALYGVDSDGLLEHIADRQTYEEALSLAQKITPGVQFPSAPILRQASSIKTPLP